VGGREKERVLLLVICRLAFRFYARKLSRRNSVRLSVRHTGGSVKNGASYRITKSLPSAACL